MIELVRMINKTDITHNESYWNNMSDDELNEYIERIFNYYRQEGFPYYSTDTESRENDFRKLKNYDYTQVWDENVIKQTMHGLGLAWSYFPHSFEVKCNSKLSPYDAFIDDKIFRKVITKRLKMGTYMSNSGILKMLKIYSGVQGVSNFRPTAAAAIYERYAPNGVVWDMSGGWGGRMLGAIISSVNKYIVTEPSTKTHQGLVNLANDFGGMKQFIITCSGSEDYIPSKESLDLCFTSPPYYDLEEYCDEKTQSYIKFNTKQSWVEGFLKPTFENCYYGLKPKKYMLINIADPKGKHSVNLEEETIRVAKEVGFKYVGEHKLALSNVNLRGKNSKFKYEPIFRFIKL